ncbi:MAG TPA: fibronectin type III domain-containing protein [Solirubrobacteraceae bacterium]|nr:fibronectin type III domain-containing protein [Solirubrobacteraceae bacterium]
MRLILATLLALGLLPGAAAAAPNPIVTTGPAQPVGQTTATLTGTVDPNKAARSYRFEYGTTTEYGLQTADATTTDGDDAEAVQATVEGLTPATTYHFRLVADDVAGADRTFRTIDTPRISRLRVAEKTATSARLSALINPNGAATAYHVQWGTTTSLGRSTPDQTLPAGTRAVPVTIELDRLPSYRRIYWRVVATNAAGVKRSGRTSFTTARAPSGVTLGVLPAVTTWSRSVSISGRVLGAGVNGLRVALQQTSFPFDAGYHQVATARTNRHGEFRFPERPVFLATRFRAVTLAAPALASPELRTRVRSRVALHRTHRKRRSLRLHGHVNPGLPTGAATLQRRRRSGGWRSVAQRTLRPQDELRSTYAFEVRRRHSAKRYRVVVAAHDGGAHARGYSRSVLVGKKRKR